MPCYIICHPIVLVCADLCLREHNLACSRLQEEVQSVSSHKDIVGFYNSYRGLTRLAAVYVCASLQLKRLVLLLSVTIGLVPVQSSWL